MEEQRIKDEIKDIEKTKADIMDLREGDSTFLERVSANVGVDLEVVQDVCTAVFEEEERLIEEFNERITELKSCLKTISHTEEGMKDFDGGFKLQNRIDEGYKPSELLSECPDILLEPGVVTRVNKDKIRDLTKSGRFEVGVVNKAYYRAIVRAVYGPKAITK